MFIDGFSKLDGRGLIGVILATCVASRRFVQCDHFKKGGQDVDLIPAVFVGGLISACLMLPMALPFVGFRSRSHHFLCDTRRIPAWRALHAHGCMRRKVCRHPNCLLLSLLEVLVGAIVGVDGSR